MCSQSQNIILIKFYSTYREQIEMATIYTPWALRNGLMGTFFMNVCFEKHLTESVEVLRKKLNIVKPPTGSLDNDIWKVN